MAAYPARTPPPASIPLRPRLIRIAYRMLGSVADAEDVVQEAFLRWLDADRDAVREPEAYLRRVVSRLCLDQLKSARRRRETYIGPWLPEPVVEAEEDEIDDVTLPLMIALERLSPLERAAFLLHDVFGVGFEEVAETIGREPATCRQLASRARAHVRAQRPRFSAPKERGLEIAAAFFSASRNGDMGQLRSLLAEDVAFYSDGGENGPRRTGPSSAPTASRASMLRSRTSSPRECRASCATAPSTGCLGSSRSNRTVRKRPRSEIVDDKIVGIYVMRNPDKLRHLGAQAVH